jgi:hypothetical protein
MQSQIGNRQIKITPTTPNRAGTGDHARSPWPNNAGPDDGKLDLLGCPALATSLLLPDARDRAIEHDQTISLAQDPGDVYYQRCELRSIRDSLQNPLQVRRVTRA